MRLNNVLVFFSLILSAANILGSSGLMVWIDHAIQYEEMGHSAYYPLISYLLGLSFGCCFVGLISIKTPQVLSKVFFSTSLVISFGACVFISLGEGVFSEEIALLLRFLWGWASGCAVVLGRVILASSGERAHTHRNFSVLSLALATLPLIVPISFAFMGLNERSIASTSASILYATMIVVFLLTHTYFRFGDSSPSIAASARRASIMSCVSLVAINVCFFLTLMLVPMVRALNYPELSLFYLYSIVLGLWLLFGGLIAKFSEVLPVGVRLEMGFLAQFIILACCLWLVYFGSFFALISLVFLVFLSSMLVQPILFSALGGSYGNKLLLFGVQSGLYILIVCFALTISMYFSFSVNAVVLMLASFVTLSIIFFYFFQKFWKRHV